MAAKLGSKGREISGLQQGAVEVIAALFKKPVVSAPKTIFGHARRAGPFKVPASMASSGDAERRVLANRFKQHLRGVSGASKLGADPDEYVPPARTAEPRERLGLDRPMGVRSGRLGLRWKPGVISGMGRPGTSRQNDNDDDD
jgi:hypothetical protein